MSQTISDTLPLDAGSQKFMGLVDPSTGNFTLLRAISKQTFSSKDYAALGVLPIWDTDTTHSAASVTTSASKAGTGQSSTSAVDGRGYNKCTAFVTISGLLTTATVDVRLVPRYTQTGDDFDPATVIASALGNGDNIVTFDVTSPYFMIEAEASSGTATVTINLYLHRS